MPDLITGGIIIMFIIIFVVIRNYRNNGLNYVELINYNEDVNL